eukprot:CAMPEP_0197173922 /NCGR_PEP_ID=MMETSP1423-20130617/658_1 /TAXON_ID=476441 /ORGANISM="Pseudo-nitzschia heimii, Strain UNC1101" /LENGTH=358 /DNA_ID=CAMNT_0042622791 /DNA_START=977 /DNA_END=2053 /DNA_ORIENTATION=-
MLETIELPKETVDLPTAVDATPRDVAEPVGEADEEWEEEKKEEDDDEKDEKLVTFGPLPNEEPPASVLILDFLCNASFLPQACSGCFHDDAADWERIAYSMEHKSWKKEKTSKRSSRTKNKASLWPRAMVVTVRDGRDESVDDGESASTRKSTDDSSTISHTSGSGGGSSSNSNSNGNSHSKSGARPPRYRRPQLPPRVPSSRRTSWSSNSSLSPIVIGEQRDDVEVSKGRNRYKEQLSAAAAGLLRKKSRDRNKDDDRKPPSYTISVKSYHPARDAPSEAPLEDTKNDDSTISDIGELTASDDDNDDMDKENDSNKDNNNDKDNENENENDDDSNKGDGNDKEHEGTKSAVVTMGSF